MAIYNEAVTVTFSNYTGTTYYTLDGSDPLDDRNIARRVYVEPFKVLPIGHNVVNVHFATVEDGHASVSTYPSNPTIIEFGFTCNPWKISESSMDSGVATVTSEGALKLYTGASIERRRGFSGDYYFGFNLLDAIGNSSLVLGFQSYLGVVNNLAEGEYTSKWKSPSLTILDRVGDVITCGIGYRKGLVDKNHFDEIGRFDWNITEPLPVAVYVKDELIVPEDSKVYRASDLHEQMFDPYEIEPNGVRGIVVNSDSPKNIIVYDIPAHTQVLVYVDADSLSEGANLFITKKGNAPGSELLISTSWGLFEMDDTYAMTDEGTVSLYVGDGMILTKMDNFVAYRSTKKMKLRVNGLETEYVQASNVDVDYLMMNLMEVNSESDSSIEISDIKGGCL